MKVATDFFYKELIKKYPLKKDDAILDYGCGPGFLVGNLIASGVDVTGADINEHFLQQNRIKFPTVEFAQLSGEPDFTFNKQFDIIVLLSIVQYFNSQQDVEAVVVRLKNYLKPGGKIIIADVLGENTSSAKDAIGIFVQCVRRGRILAFARFIIYLMSSDYRRTSKNSKLLSISSDFMTQLAERNFLRLETVRNMTPHPTRNNYTLRIQ